MNYLWDNQALLDAGQKKIIRSIWNNSKKGSSARSLSKTMTQTVTYKLSGKGGGKLGYGRYYSSIGGLETIEKQARGSMCVDYYHDIDIVNCHPIILVQFANQKYQYDLPELEYYCSHRNKVLAKINDDRDAAKTEVIRIIYGGLNNYDVTLKLSNEIRAFTKMLSRKDEYKDLWESVQTEDNKYGTFLSFIIQTEERKCMLVMKESLEKDGWSVDVLCYDGVMVRKREGVSLADSISNAEKAMLEKTGWDLSLIEKPMSSYELPPLSAGEEVANGVSRLQYDEMKREFEVNRFYHIPSNQVVEVQPNGEMLYMTTQHANSYLSCKWNFKRTDKLGDYTSFVPLWLGDANRRQIRLIDFKPSSDPEVFALPLHYAYEAIDESRGDPKALELFLELVGLMSRDEQKEYFLNWLAHLIQTPLENPKVSVVVTGVKGCGKDTLFDFLMEYVVGRTYSINYEDNNQFFAPHDQGRLNKFLVKIEEADYEVCRKNASTLKSRITSDWSTFNPKGVKEITTANYNRNVFTTNKGNPFEMDQGERRFLVLNALATHKGNHAYWSNVRKVLFTPEGGRAVADFLLKRDISGWVKQDIPMSEYQKAVVESETSSEQQFIDSWDGLPTNDIDYDRPDVQTGEKWDEWVKMAKREFTATELYRMYKGFCMEKELPYSANVKSFGKSMLILLRDGIISKRRGSDGIFYRRG
jgi:hypothetical protein